MTLLNHGRHSLKPAFKLLVKRINEISDEINNIDTSIALIPETYTTVDEVNEALSEYALKKYSYTKEECDNTYATKTELDALNDRCWELQDSIDVLSIEANQNLPQKINYLLNENSNLKKKISDLENKLNENIANENAKNLISLTSGRFTPCGTICIVFKLVSP